MVNEIDKWLIFGTVVKIKSFPPNYWSGGCRHCGTAFANAQPRIMLNDPNMKRFLPLHNFHAVNVSSYITTLQEAVYYSLAFQWFATQGNIGNIVS